MQSIFKRLTLAFGVLLSLLSAPVFAEVYHLSGDLTYSSGDDVGSGGFNITFTTAGGDAADADGASVIDISGTFFGRSITGLSTFNSADNKLYDSDHHYFDFNGISFSFAPTLGVMDMDAANLFYSDGSSKWFEPVGTFASIGCSDCNVQYSLYKMTTTTTAVPEPETYVMLMVGLGLLGFASRKRKYRQLKM